MFWYGPGHMAGWGFAGAGAIIMIITALLVWAVLVTGLAVLVRYLRGPRSAARPETTEGRGTPESVLADRYARGEIDDEEYHRRLETLRGAGRR